MQHAQKSFRKPHRICFTHGEVRPNNLLALNGRLSGLVDWETAGSFPEYCDYVGGCYIVPPMWVVFHRIFPQYEHELEVDDEIGNVPSAHPMAGWRPLILYGTFEFEPLSQIKDDLSFADFVLARCICIALRLV